MFKIFKSFPRILANGSSVPRKFTTSTANDFSTPKGSQTADDSSTLTLTLLAELVPLLLLPFLFYYVDQTEWHQNSMAKFMREKKLHFFDGSGRLEREPSDSIDGIKKHHIKKIIDEAKHMLAQEEIKALTKQVKGLENQLSEQKTLLEKSKSFGMTASRR